MKLQKAGLGYASGQFDINDAMAEANEKNCFIINSKRKRMHLSLRCLELRMFSTGKILLNNVDLFNQYTAGVTGTSTATEMAEKNSNTLTNRTG